MPIPRFARDRQRRFRHKRNGHCYSGIVMKPLIAFDFKKSSK
eukprot:gene26379-biopygen16183